MYAITFSAGGTVIGMNRRAFLFSSAGALAAPRTSRASDNTVTVLVNEPIGPISPLVHGHFVEHLGGVVYDGIWVGENSRIPNVGGMRKALIDALKKINAPLFRWPGGCFADSYNWRDGVGPRAARPRRSNFWIDNRHLEKAPPHAAKYDPNAFGTNEFLRFCQETGGKAYIAANVRSGSPRDFYDWVEYCNSPAGTTTLGDLRGGPPFNVEYWGIGNESWGCGGDFTPEEYSVEFRRFTSWYPRFGVPVKLIPAGPNSGDLNWSRGFFSALRSKSPGLLGRVWGWALHYYCGTTGKGQALDFTVDDYYDLLARADRMESLITGHWAVMGEFDRDRRVKLVVDEWGAWHREGPDLPPHLLFGYNTTMRDALVAAITLDTFHRHADKIAMANVAQLVNCIHSLFIAYEDKFWATPNYHVFDLYKDHHNGQAVRAVFGAPAAPMKAPGLAGSASIKDKTLVITCSHASHDQAHPVAISVPGARVVSARADVLASATVQAHNSQAQPDLVKPRLVKPEASGSVIRLELPPASVARIVATIA